MLKAKSAETKYRIPSSDNELFRMKLKAWQDDRHFSLSKEQQAKLGKDDFEVIQRLGNSIYGKGAK